MSRALLALFCGLALLSGAFSQNPGDPELPKVLGFTYDPGTNQYTASWSGPMGRTYFFQHSEDLIHWDYFEDVLTGEGVPIEFGFVKPSLGRFFVRLISIVGVTASPLYADQDGDKVPTFLEFAHGTDPLHSGDIDGDHIPDDWESRYEPVLDFGNPNDATLDPDGDGFSNLAEYLRNSDPTDFYNGKGLSNFRGGLNGGF